MILNLILIFCAGYTFAVGGLNLAIGLLYKRDRSYLFFGLLSLFASIFLLIQISVVTDALEVDSSDVISIVTAGFFYSLFIWFIGEYTGYKKHLAQWIITLTTVFIVILFFVAKSSLISWELWEGLAHTMILSISIYGFYAGVKGLKKISRVWKIMYLLLMAGLFLFTIIVGLSLSINFILILDPEGYPSPLDFFPVFFSILIGSKMSHDVVRSYQLEAELKQKDKEWSTLMETINLLIVKLDVEGRVVWTNSYLSDFTGFMAKEINGRNWLELMLSPDDRIEVEKNFQSIIEGQVKPSYQNKIKIKNGDLKNIQWSNLPLQDQNSHIVGVLSIGTDVTAHEIAFHEIKQLKDQLEKENLLLKEEINYTEYSDEIIGESDTLLYVIKRSHQVSGTDSTVLLEGETGVGKELFANLIHRNSNRKHKPFIKVNCASLPKDLIESELFGHEKGSFTGAIKTRQGRFELADKGTIFLDEIGELPLDLQPKLLRVLQSGEFERIGSEKTKFVDVRIVAATNRNLEEESGKGNFRHDLFFRLNVYPITIPPLRHRKEDISMLIKHFTHKIGKKIGRKIKQISKSDIMILEKYEWPGNIRELENVLERAIINSEGDVLQIDKKQLKSAFSENSINDHNTTLSNTEKNHIIVVLNECHWKINGDNGAAIKLGMPPSTLRSKMKKLNIIRPKIN